MAEPQPPEGLRMVAYRAARDWATTHNHPQPDDRMVDAVLVALLYAPGVRLELGASHDSCEHWGIWPTEEALSKWLAAREGWRRTWRLIIAEPPVSSTGEEKTGGN